MKKTMAILVVLGTVWSGAAAVVYRGRLAHVEHPQAMQSFSGTRTMTFRFYDDVGVQQGGEIVRDVPLETNGTFTVLLDSAELTENLQAGKATQVGVTIGSAAKELRPLRKLLPTAQATEVTRAAGLAARAKVGEMTAGNIEAKKMSVGGNLTVGGAIRPDDGANVFDRVSYVVRLGEGAKLLSKGELRVLGKPVMLTPQYGAPLAVQANDYIPADAKGTQVVAPADGVATISCADALSESDVGSGRGTASGSLGAFFGARYSANCLVVKFCRKGEAIMVPDGWDWQPPDYDDHPGYRKKHFSVRFHPFVSAE